MIEPYYSLQKAVDRQTDRQTILVYLAAVTDGHVVLILLLRIQTRRQLTLATKRQILHG